MGKKELSGRDNWERDGGTKASQAEQNLYEAFRNAFLGTNYVLYEKPTHLKNLYAQVRLPPDVQAQIYNPPIDLESTQWGVSPDFAIENRTTGKIIFGEIKRQDGWVEGKEPSAGRGNAHERLCKLFTPGLLKTYRRISKIHEPDFLPFWVVFEGDITRDPKRVREISFWFDSFKSNYFMWRPTMGDKELIDFFVANIKSHLE